MELCYVSKPYGYNQCDCKDNYFIYRPPENTTNQTERRSKSIHVSSALRQPPKISSSVSTLKSTESDTAIAPTQMDWYDQVQRGAEVALNNRLQRERQAKASGGDVSLKLVEIKSPPLWKATLERCVSVDNLTATNPYTESRYKTICRGRTKPQGDLFLHLKPAYLSKLPDFPSKDIAVAKSTTFGSENSK